MIQIALTPDQLRAIAQATESVALVDGSGRIVAEIEVSSERSPDQVIETASYATLEELIADLEEPEWDEAELKRILDHFVPAGTLSGLLQSPRLSSCASPSNQIDSRNKGV